MSRYLTGKCGLIELSADIIESESIGQIMKTSKRRTRALVNRPT